jgi:hypothetical protein
MESIIHNDRRMELGRDVVQGWAGEEARYIPQRGVDIVRSPARCIVFILRAPVCVGGRFLSYDVQSLSKE